MGDGHTAAPGDMMPPQPPRLLMVTTVHGTMQAFLLPFADRLRAQGWTVHALCAPRPSTQVDGDTPLSTHFDAVHDAPWARELRPASALRDLLGLVRSPAMVRTLIDAQRFDVVHVHTPIAAMITRFALRRHTAARRPQLIYTAHGFHAYAGAGWLRNLVFRMAERYAARWTDYLVVINRHDHTLARLDQLVRHDHLALHLGIGVDMDRYRPATPEERRQTREALGITANTFTVAVVAEFNHNKRQADVIDALAQLRAGDTPPPTVLFVGDGPLRARVEARAKDRHVHEHCRFLGQRDDVPALVAACDALLSASAREGLPRNLLEAMSMQVPIVVSSARGARDLAGDDRGLCYATGQTHALAGALVALQREPAAAAARARRARAWVTSHASFSRIAALHDDLYDRARRGAALVVQRVEADECARAAFGSRPDLKRAVDILFAAAGLVLLLPLLLVIAIAVRTALGAPVLFRQQRPGRLGVPFTLIKFRTMHHATDSRGRSLSDRERLGPFGRWLRASSLDELPELWNVLRGDMSLVGPRPLLMEYLSRYTAAEHRRHDVRPGITGWAQVNGRNAQSWPERFAHDLWYVDHHTLRLDLRILARTVQRVWRRDGITAAGEATMTPYVPAVPASELEITRAVHDAPAAEPSLR